MNIFFTDIKYPYKIRSYLYESDSVHPKPVFKRGLKIIVCLINFSPILQAPKNKTKIEKKRRKESDPPF